MLRLRRAFALVAQLAGTDGTVDEKVRALP